MATGSRKGNSQWVNPYHEQVETPAELKKRKRKEAKEKEAKEKEEREAKEREREAKEREKRETKERERREAKAKKKEEKEKEAKRKEAKEKEKALKRQKHGEGNSSDKHSQGQPHTPDTTDHFSIPNIPVDLDKTWAEYTGEGRKSSAPSDSSLSPPSTQKMESVSVMPNKEVFLTLPDIPGGVSRDDTESHHLSSDHEMKQQFEKEIESDHPFTGVHLQTQEVDKGDTSLEFSLVNENAKLVVEKLELETQQIALKEEIDVLNHKVENFTKQNEDLSLELSQTKNELQYTKESMEKEKKDALSLVETEKATLVAKLERDLQTAEAVKRELQNDKEYWSRSQPSKERELQAKLASVQDELTTATAIKVAIEKQFIRVQAQYEEQQKRVDQLQTDLSTAQEGMKLRDITIGELNGRIKERTETTNIQLKGDQITLKEKEEEIDGLQHKNQVLKEDMKKRDEELLNVNADLEKMRKDLERISKELQEKAKEIDNHATDLVAVVERTEKRCKEDFEKDKMEFERLIQKLNQEQDEINDATTARITKLESDLEQKEKIITQYFQELKQKEQLQSSLSRLDGEDRVNIEQLNSQLKSDSLENIQSTGGAGASPHTSLSEEGKKLDDLYQQVAAKDDKIADLEKQLYLMTMESNSLQETKKQLEQMMQRGEGSVQQSTLTPDHMALIAQMEEYDKAKQDLEAEKRAMKNVGEKNSELQMEVDRLKQQLLRIETDSQSGTTVLASPVNMSETATSQLDDSLVEDLRRLLKEREEEAKALVDSINQKEKTLTNTTAKYEDLLKSTKSMSIALKERNEHVQKQSKKIVQFRKEAEYYRSETERLTALNQQLDVGGHQLQEEAATVQKSLYRVKHEVSEATKELQSEIQKLKQTVEEREEVIKQVTNELDEKNKLVQQQYEEGQIQKLEIEAGMRSELSMKDIEMQELRVGLKEVNEVLQSSLDDKQQSLVAANELAKKLRDDSAESMRAVNTKQREIDELHKKLQEKSQLEQKVQNELTIKETEAQLYKEDFNKERSDRTKAYDQYSQKITQYESTIKKLRDEGGKNAAIIAQLQHQIAVLSKEKKSLDDLRKSLQSKEDIRKHQDEERAGIDTQLRAYKRQADELRRQLTEEKEKQEVLKKSLEKKTGIEERNIKYDAKVHDLQVLLTNEEKKFHDLQVLLTNEQAQLADELKSKDHIMGGVQTLQQQVHTLQQQLSEANRKYQEEMEKMRNANMRLQHKLRESWDAQAALQQELIVLRQVGRTHKPHGSPYSNVHQPQTHVGGNQVVMAGQRHHEFPLQAPEQATSQEEHMGKVQQPPFHNINVSSNIPQFHAVPQPQGLVEDPRLLHHQFEQQRLLSLEQQSKQEQLSADLALKELEDAKRQRNQPHQLVSRRLHSTNAGIGSRTNIGQGQTRTNVEMESQRPHQQVSDEIPENAILYGVDDDIQKYADDIRRMTQPPQTQEFTTIEDTSLPYDPNLVCPKCGKRYRIGEIQKLGRHVNEFCTAK